MRRSLFKSSLFAFRKITIFSEKIQEKISQKFDFQESSLPCGMTFFACLKTWKISKYSVILSKILEIRKDNKISKSVKNWYFLVFFDDFCCIWWLFFVLSVSKLNEEKRFHWKFKKQFPLYKIQFSCELLLKKSNSLLHWEF